MCSGWSWSECPLRGYLVDLLEDSKWWCSVWDLRPCCISSRAILHLVESDLWWPARWEGESLIILGTGHPAIREGVRKGFVDFELFDTGGGLTGFLWNYITLHLKEIPNFHTIDWFFWSIPPHITYLKETPNFHTLKWFITQLYHPTSAIQENIQILPLNWFIKQLYHPIQRKYPNFTP